MPSLDRAWGHEKLRSGETFAMPKYIVVRGTVSAVDVAQESHAEILFREAPAAPGKPYLELHACSARLDVLREQFGADYRTSMVGKTIEVRTEVEQSACRGQAWGMNISLAREVRSIAHIEMQRRAQNRLSAACQAAPDAERPACMQRVLPEAMKEGQRAEQCAREVIRPNPAIRTEPFWTGVTACMQRGN